MTLLEKVLSLEFGHKIGVRLSCSIAYYKSTTWKSIKKKMKVKIKKYFIQSKPRSKCESVSIDMFCSILLSLFVPPISLRGTSRISTLIKTHFMGYYYYSYGVAIHKTGIPSDWGHFLEGLTQQSHNPWLLFRLTVFLLDDLLFIITTIKLQAGGSLS